MLFFLFVGVRIAQINPAEKKANHKHVVIQGESCVLTQAVHELFFLEVKNQLPVGGRYCRSKLNLNEIHQWWYCKLISLLSHSYTVFWDL